MMLEATSTFFTSNHEKAAFCARLGYCWTLRCWHFLGWQCRIAAEFKELCVLEQVINLSEPQFVSSLKQDKDTYPGE